MSKNTKTAFKKPELSVEDLTLALHQANLKLMKTNCDLQESEKMRTELLSNLSHDLRSPISTLQSYVEYLLSFDTLDETEVFSILNKMQTKLHSLVYLLNQLMTISTIDSIDTPLNIEKVYIQNFLEDYYYSCKSEPKYADRNLLLQLQNISQLQIDIDKLLFTRVLDNLFTNALKYSHSGASITLGGYIENECLTIYVSDTGIGIDQYHLPHIFERTYMISDARTPDSSKGCGLGLSIAMSIVELHHGTIWCESTLGEGSTFYIKLQLK